MSMTCLSGPEACKEQLPTLSMRFVSAHFRVETGRCRGPCQLKTSRQAQQQLRRHFVVVKAFAFACPRVPSRVGSFLRPRFCFIGNSALFDRKHSKTAAVSLTAVELISGSLRWAALANEFKEIKLSISAGLREARVCQSIGADPPFLLAQPHVDRCVAQRPLALARLVPQGCRPKTQIMFATQR